ncbi:MAG TPA: Ig-like domain-containing protein [Kofleriaceae bacterium]|jgi:uncharacterized protein (TIGR03382 family)
MLRLLSGATALVVGLSSWLVAGTASAEPALETRFPGQGDSINEDPTPTVALYGNRLLRVMETPTLVTPAVNSNIIFLNNCKPNGCIIKPGATSSIDGSGYQGTWGINQTKTLAAFNQSDAVWNDVVACVKDVFSPFGVTITTTNPSPNPHFEIMIAGISTQIGLPANYLGVSPATCSAYIPNSLVFDFANSTEYQGAVEDMCATAAQEIAHSFSLDHTTDSSDPMTYFTYASRKRFKNGAVNCGSDCVNSSGAPAPNGTSPTGFQCTNQTHPCICNGNTQNSFVTLKNLFGPGTPTPPVVSFVNPKDGAAVAPGFGFSVTATDDNGLGGAEGFVDNVTVGTLITQPYAFNAPATITNGSHTIKVVVTDIYGATTTVSENVIIGDPCMKPSDCPTSMQTCIGGRCVSAPGTVGGLGGTCTGGEDCSSGICGAVNGGMFCLEECTTGQCPDGFGCQAAAGTGYCVAGFDDGSGGGGGCSTSNDATGPLCGLLFGAFVLVRRRRRG